MPAVASPPALADSAPGGNDEAAGVGYQIGLDTGGTFTDAVLVDDALAVCATAKALTRHDDLARGLGDALDAVLGAGAGGDVTLVSLSTTLATNALVEGRGRAVGLVLIGIDRARLGQARLAEALDGDPFVCIAGGHDAGGGELLPLDEASLVNFVARHDDAVEAWAVSALFATRNPAHEERARALIARTTGKPTSLGHVLSAGLDAPRRALTALLNARLVPLIGELLDAAETLLAARAIAAPLMVVKGDGSLIGAGVARNSPVETILSGPAASLVGARALCGEADLLVADTGGTTTDIARLVDGVPRLAADGATVGGWRTMVRAVDVRTVALGGDGELSIEAVRGRGFRLGNRRVVPLGLLTSRHPALLEVLRAQLAAPRPTPHEARFVLPHRPPTPAALARLGAAERELLARVAKGPIALATLFAERSRERALERLERAALVQLAAFTPSDASQLAGTHDGWCRDGAELGARLLMRGARASGASADDARFASPSAFARAACRHVAERVALALADAVAAEDAVLEGRASDGAGNGLTACQRELLERGFASVSLAEHEAPEAIAPEAAAPSLRVRVALGLPIAGLGAPAASYHAPAARLLGTRALLPGHGDVANALGAVAGRVRQEARVTIVSAGGNRAKALLAGGPVVRETLGEAFAAAADEARARAVALAAAAGVGSGDIVTKLSREDDVVERDGMTVFLECRVTVVASGRPASGV